MAKPEVGGYGLIDANTMNMSIKASWIARWIREGEGQDYPSYYATGLDVRKIEQISPDPINTPLVILDIVKMWAGFMVEYYKHNCNILRAKIFENVSLKGETGEFINKQIFNANRWGGIRERWIDLEVRHLITEEWVCLTKEEIEDNTGTGLNYVEYFRLRTEIRNLEQKFRGEQNRPMDIHNFVRGIKKGCNKIRTYLDGAKCKKYRETKTTELPSINTLLGQHIEEGDENLIRINLKLWTIGRLESGFKEFLFKYFQGKLYLNNILANIDGTHPSCTFCKLGLERDRANIAEAEYNIRLNNLPVETVDHIFIGCQFVRLIVRNICVNGLMTGDFEEKKYLMGNDWTNSMEGITIRCILLHYVKYTIYVMRKSRVLPTLQKIRFECRGLIQNLKKNRRWQPFLRNINLV